MASPLHRVAITMHTIPGKKTNQDLFTSVGDTV